MGLCSHERCVPLCFLLRRRRSKQEALLGAQAKSWDRPERRLCSIERLPGARDPSQVGRGSAWTMMLRVPDMLEQDLFQEGRCGARARQAEKYSLGNKVRDRRPWPPRPEAAPPRRSLRAAPFRPPLSARDTLPSAPDGVPESAPPSGEPRAECAGKRRPRRAAGGWEEARGSQGQEGGSAVGGSWGCWGGVSAGGGRRRGRRSPPGVAAAESEAEAGRRQRRPLAAEQCRRKLARGFAAPEQGAGAPFKLCLARRGGVRARALGARARRAAAGEQQTRSRWARAVRRAVRRTPRLNTRIRFIQTT